MDKSIDESADYQKGNDYYIELDEKLEFYNYNAKNKDVCYYISIDESGETHRLKKPWSILNFLNLFGSYYTNRSYCFIYAKVLVAFYKQLLKKQFCTKGLVIIIIEIVRSQVINLKTCVQTRLSGCLQTRLEHYMQTQSFFLPHYL